MSTSPHDAVFMRRALQLAARAKGRTSPNPMVGALVVRQNTVVGEGYHRRAGAAHAEILALKQAAGHARDATLYVTLEPCCHTKKRTPPCVPEILRAGIRRVVLAMRDPNPRVSGRGVRQLRRAGVAVEVGCLESEARQLNRIYAHWIATGRPYVMVKSAMTMDGKIATARGESQWITGEGARRHAHQLRSEVDAIMVGAGTVLKDNPSLSARGKGLAHRARGVRQPVRVVLDSTLKIPATANVWRWGVEQSTIVCTTARASDKAVTRLEARNVRVIVLPTKEGRVSLAACLQVLGVHGLTSVLVEGGSVLNAALLHGGHVNQVYAYIAPKVLGGQDALSAFGGISPSRLARARTVHDLQIRRLGDDVLMWGTLAPL